jgi:hypothetical protein
MPPTHIKPVSSVKIIMKVVDGDDVGYTFPNGEIWIEPQLTSVQKRSLILHEFFHAIGYIGHLEKTGCYFSKTPPSNGVFCEEDIKLIEKVNLDKPIEVYSQKELELETIWAISKLNDIKELLVFKGVK